MKDPVQTKTKTSTTSKIAVGIVTAVVALVAIGAAIYFAIIAPPAGCQTKPDGSFLCTYNESFADNSNIDANNSDAWVQATDNHLVLNPSEEIKLHKGNSFDNVNVAPAKQLCGTVCFDNSCQVVTHNNLAITNYSLKDKDNNETGQNNLNFNNAPYFMNVTPFVGSLFYLFESSNPEVAVAQNDLDMVHSAGLDLVSPGKTQVALDVCGQRLPSGYQMTVNNEGFNNVQGRTNFDRNFMQGLTKSNNLSAGLSANRVIVSADVNLGIANLPGLLSEGADNQNIIDGTIMIALSNDNGNTWYLPSEYSDDSGNTWLSLHNNNDKLFIKTLANINNRVWRYNFINPNGNQLKWATVFQVSKRLVAQGQQPANANIPAQDNLIVPSPIIQQTGGANDFGVGMLSDTLIQPNSAQNPIQASDEISGGIVTNNQDGIYYFYDPINGLQSNLNSTNILVTPENPDILSYINKQNTTVSFKTDHTADLNIVKTTLHGLKPGYAKLKVDYLDPNNLDKILAEREFGFLVLPQAYLNLDQLNIAYTAIDKNIPDPGPDPAEELGVGTSTYIYRGNSRAIVKLAGANDATKNQLNSAMQSGNLKFNYGTDGNNLNQTAKVYFDTKDSKYYAVLRNLKGGEKDGFNQDGFSDGRMKYYYQFKAGNDPIFLDADRKNAVGDFQTLNRKRTILYYYNWIFGTQYDLNGDYDWAKVQDGGLNYWNNTNVTLAGIRFMMLNDQRFNQFNNTLNGKKASKQLVGWLYKKILDRIYDDNLYKFADTAGVNFWYQQMTKIRQRDRISKEGVKFAISASTEYRTQLEEIDKTKQQGDAEFAYTVVLKRGGDQQGVKYLIDIYGDSQKQMRQNLVNSFEYNNRLQSIEEKNGRRAAITELYETIYARPADVSGLNYWTNSNETVQQIKTDFLNSNEFNNVLK